MRRSRQAKARANRRLSKAGRCVRSTVRHAGQADGVPPVEQDAPATRGERMRTGRKARGIATAAAAAPPRSARPGRSPQHAARRALDLARDPWERAFFAQNVARLLAGARDFAGAADVLARVAEQDDVAPHDRIALHVLATGIALDAPDLELRARGYEPVYTGIGILKANKELTAALQAAVQSLIDDGTYGKILAKWNLSSFGVETATINGTKK